MELTPDQHHIRDYPHTGSLFAQGPAGAGKTTAAAWRLLSLLEAGIPGDHMLLFAPQQAAFTPYLRAIRASGYAGVLPATHTIGSLARFIVGQFFPLAARACGFADPTAPPVFLSLETAQYIMARLVDPLAFAASVRVDKQRIYSQILDNLNKAALVGFPHTEIADRLKAASADAAVYPAYMQAQHYADEFRAYCLTHNLLDFSLQIDVFRHLWTLAAPRDLVRRGSQHLIVDNAEEDAPIAHEVIADLLAREDGEPRSALVLLDEEGGYRRFLGADTQSAERLRGLCDHTITLAGSHIMSPPVAALTEVLGGALGGADRRADDPALAAANPLDALDFADDLRYYPQMLDWTVDHIARLVASGTPPAEIVVLAPFMTDSLRFSLLNRLAERGIPARSHRPSRSLHEEPAVECLLTWSQIAHPEWTNVPPPSVEAVAYALMLSLGSVVRDDAPVDAVPAAMPGGNPADLPADDLDLVRARLLAAAAYPSPDHAARLRPFDALPAIVRERVTYTLGQRYDALRVWLESYIAAQTAPPPSPEPPPPPKRGRKKKAAASETAEPLLTAPTSRLEIDHFFSLLYGEVLALRGFGFHHDFIAADAAAHLIDSARGFRQTMTGKAFFNDPLAGVVGKTLAEEYVEMVRGGVIANQYAPVASANADAVLLAPAYTFLNMGTPVTVQFWLDVGSRGWFERLYQPLTHPYVLSAGWEVGQLWDDDDEYATRQETLRNLMYGLLRRCRRSLFLGLSQLGENGQENAGELLAAFNRMLRRLQAERAGAGNASGAANASGAENTVEGDNRS